MWKGTHHGRAELVEKAKHWNRLGNLEGRVATPPFPNTFFSYVYTLYGWKRHFDCGGSVRFEVRRWIAAEGLRREPHFHGPNANWEFFLGFSGTGGVSFWGHCGLRWGWLKFPGKKKKKTKILLYHFILIKLWLELVN